MQVVENRQKSLHNLCFKKNRKCGSQKIGSITALYVAVRILRYT